MSKPFHEFERALHDARVLAVRSGEPCCVYLVRGRYLPRLKRKALAAASAHTDIQIVPESTFDEKGEACPDH